MRTDVLSPSQKRQYLVLRSRLMPTISVGAAGRKGGLRSAQDGAVRTRFVNDFSVVRGFSCPTNGAFPPEPMLPLFFRRQQSRHRAPAASTARQHHRRRLGSAADAAIETKARSPAGSTTARKPAAGQAADGVPSGRFSGGKTAEQRRQQTRNASSAIIHHAAPAAPLQGQTAETRGARPDTAAGTAATAPCQDRFPRLRMASFRDIKKPPFAILLFSSIFQGR